MITEHSVLIDHCTIDTMTSMAALHCTLACQLPIIFNLAEEVYI